MKYERSEQYKGYQISGKASPSCMRWQSLLTVRRARFHTEAMGVVPLCDTAQGAVDQALHAARLMIDSAGFSLQTAGQPDGAPYRAASLDPGGIAISNRSGGSDPGDAL